MKTPGIMFFFLIVDSIVVIVSVYREMFVCKDLVLQETYCYARKNSDIV